MHDLRHAHASWLLAGGADLKAVMERMGHSQLLTAQRYLHTLPDADERALAAFERIRSRKLPKPAVTSDEDTDQMKDPQGSGTNEGEGEQRKAGSPSEVRQVG